ncbi:hypothetical protein RJZ56_007559 [Blastomyces dermatitidis]|uniref:Antigen n=2 Tax=Blastomyces TaxID=229219 RepID=A0A179UT10_BLAGS|nr:antigen [Blastomyces gilchristii SLH14081]EGE85879.1 hypothetical protein BDDG_08824 [Blastomyces dermatitidis ATCC 18188]OAT10171.1 antigen [Blastomyces gilchristii SLH14081]
MAPLSPDELRTVVSALAQKLDSLNIDYAIMGGAATCLLYPDPTRRTEDVDLLLTSFPTDFEGVSQFRHTIPAYKLRRPGGAAQLVELEVFDFQSWPQRPQYNIQAATRKTLNINGRAVKFFGAEWILREKILSQYQRQGSPKEGTDIRDITNMIPLAVPGRPELDFNQSQELQTALANLVQKRPALVQSLKAKVKCTAVFQN